MCIQLKISQHYISQENLAFPPPRLSIWSCIAEISNMGQLCSCLAVFVRNYLVRAGSEEQFYRIGASRIRGTIEYSVTKARSPHIDITAGVDVGLHFYDVARFCSHHEVGHT